MFVRKCLKILIMGPLMFAAGCFQNDLKSMEFPISTESDGNLKIVKVQAFKDINDQSIVIKGAVTDGSSNPYAKYRGQLILRIENESGQIVHEDKIKMNLESNTGNPGLDRNFQFSISPEINSGKAYLLLRSK